MRFVPFLSFVMLLFSFLSCKSKSESELKATEAQKNKFKRCIVTTITQTFASSKDDPKAVEGFADEMVKRAPSENDKAADAAFEEYVGSLGCDPKRVGSNNSVGTSLVAEWVISPLNPRNAKTAPIATSKP